MRIVHPVPRYTPKLIVTLIFIVIEDSNPTENPCVNNNLLNGTGCGGS